ncbi:DUF4190 domain-containing protein [Mycolicibacterium llatzerense]|uniref:DUF4190 domain-containing protein n=1 Tax=Mycolicibacterium llatzerense TaxID=280871 RepID=A0A0D1LK44_9MYCO|nr:DUF4190 domain-containing protein [Mycolicibacterium llatzerense]KIU16406.1 hypothetical protein TL10_13510 [Mycolicibacterium llatzerense]
MSMYPGGGYPPPPPPPYANATYGPYTAAPRNGMGTTALVLGIVGLLTSWSVVGGLLFGLGAVACGVIGRNRVKEGLADNAVVAGAGIALGALATVLAVVFVFVVIGFYRQVGFSDYTNCMTRAGQDQNAQSTCVQDFRSRIEKEFGVKVEG